MIVQRRMYKHRWAKIIFRCEKKKKKKNMNAKTFFLAILSSLYKKVRLYLYPSNKIYTVHHISATVARSIGLCLIVFVLLKKSTMVSIMVNIKSSSWFFSYNSSSSQVLPPAICHYVVKYINKHVIKTVCVNITCDASIWFTPECK